MLQRYLYENRMFAPLEPGRNVLLQIAIRFYSFRLHYILIPLIIIYAAIHLGFAIHYFGQCPMQPLIVIYMIVHAAVHLGLIILAMIGVIIVQCIYPRNETIGMVLLITLLFCQIIIILFNLAWTIAGSVWIFGAKANGVQGDNPAMTTTYCQTHLFRAAFALLIINYVVHALLVIVVVVIWIWRIYRRVNRHILTLNTRNYRV